MQTLLMNPKNHVQKKITKVTFKVKVKILIDIISAHHLNEITIRFWVVAAHGVLVLKSHYSKWLVTRHMSANHHEGTMDRKSWPWQVKSKVWEYSLHYCSANRAFKISELQALYIFWLFLLWKKNLILNESKHFFFIISFCIFTILNLRVIHKF